MRVSLTGRISIEANGTSVDEQRFPGRQGRLVFAYLLSEQGRPVPRDELAEALWGEALPATWEKALAVLVSKLRALLQECGINGQEALKSAFGCYQLVLPDGSWIDVRAATENAERAEAALATGHVAEAKASAAAAAALARRTFLPGEHGSWVEERRRDLHEVLVRSLECLADACLQSGRADEAVKHAEEVTTLEPFRESAYRRLMQAHAAAGNNAEALRVYERCRHLLADELGAYPSPETETTYLEILRTTPSRADGADAHVSARDTETKRSGVSTARLALLGIAGAACAAVLAVTLPRSSQPGLAARLGPDTVGAIDSSGRIADRVTLGSRPAALTTGGGYVWVAGADGTVSRIDPKTHAVRTADVGHSAAGIAFESGSLWVTRTDMRAVVQLSPETLELVQTIDVGNGPTAIAGGSGSLWVTNTIDGTVSRIGLASGRVTGTVPLGGQPSAVAFGEGSVWVASQDRGSVVVLDPRSLDVVTAIDVGNGPAGIAAGAGGIWIANRQDGTVSRLDPAAHSVSMTIPVGAGPASVALGSEAVWVAIGGEGRIVRIDPRDGRVEKSITIESSPGPLAFADGKLWISALPSLASHRGGVLRVESGPSICTCVDPAVPDFSIVGLVHDGLLAYRRVGGAAGGELVANLAVGVPLATNQGRTYSFQLRDGIRYSDGTTVRASDFRYGIERLLTINRSGAPAYDVIVGARSCGAASSRRCDLSRGIEIDDSRGRVTIHLTRADPDFLYKLTLPYASLVPVGSPLRVVRDRAIPGTGPYRVTSVTPGRSVRLARNPHFRVWSTDARPDGFPDEIRVRFRASATARVAAVKLGKADWIPEPPPEELAGLLTRYADRIHSNPAPSTDYMFLNTREPPFDDVRVRRALNYAVDRENIVEFAGGPLAARATCQVLPPLMPGYRPYCPYTLRPNDAGTWTAPDLTRAQALVAASGTRGSRVVVYGYDARGRLEYARYVVALLRRLGYRSSLRVIPDLGTYFHYTADSRRRVQIGVLGWYADFAAPSLFLKDLFSCASFRPGSGLNLNYSAFCDPRIDDVMSRASRLQASDPVRANTAWARVDRALMERAVVAPLVTRNQVAFVSRRVGNYQFHPQWGTLLDQLWVQ